MGNARWDDRSYANYSASVSHKTREEIFTARSMDQSLDPAKIKFRESVDSPANPASTPIILACDETGSMGHLAEQIIRTDLGAIMRGIYDTKPVTDPHIMCMGVGDAACDMAPLQVTQFEAGVSPLVAQIEKIWIEGKGGGNNGESYPLAWWFATYKCLTDAWRKRSRKGFLFTIGDECPLPVITADQIRRFMGVSAQHDVDIRSLLKAASEYWHIFHLIIKPVDTQPVVRTWKDILGQRAIEVSDHSLLADGIVSILRVINGEDADAVARSATGDSAIVVRSVVSQLATAGA